VETTSRKTSGQMTCGFCGGGLVEEVLDLVGGGCGCAQEEDLRAVRRCWRRVERVVRKSASLPVLNDKEQVSLLVLRGWGDW